MDTPGFSRREPSEVRCDDGSRPYVRRHPEDGVLHRVLREHLETFLAEARARGDGEGLPAFVERELREFLSCGSMARGFARFRCDDCGHEILVAFSCKGRGFCPSCGGRRMAELAAHLVDDVLGGLPVRQWVLTVPHRLRYAMAWDHEICRAVLGVFTRALLAFEAKRAEARGIPGGRGGAVTAIQRFGSSLNLNVHFHTLAIQGVFVDDTRRGLRFVPNPEPTTLEVIRLLASIWRRITRLARRRGIELEPEGAGHPETELEDPLGNESPLLSGICGASVIGRVATGPRAGKPIVRLGRGGDATLVTSAAEHHAHADGFDLHAAVSVPAGDRERLEHLCGYVLRPPVAQGALQPTPDGKVLLTMRRKWRDGTRAILFEPSELIERLAVLIPKPRINLLLYHGVFGPAAKRRSAAVATARWYETAGEGLPRPAPEPLRFEDGRERCKNPAGRASDRPHEPVRDGPGQGQPTSLSRRGGHFPWADLLQRTFGIDILSCPGCGGRLRFLATIEDPKVVRKILEHLDLPTAVPEAAPARPPPWAEQGFFPLPDSFT